jgi:adenosylhomocysteine nucleosidase
MNILVVTPLQKELDFFLQGCRKQGFHAENSTIGRLPVVQLPDLGITLAVGGAGKAQFAVHTQHLLGTSAGWELVICAGAAGALVDSLAIGDVVVATATLEHDYNNRFNARPLPHFDGAEAVIADLKRVAPSVKPFNVLFGPVASGDEDVIDDARRGVVRQLTGGLAVAWEGAGGARACAFNGVPFIEIRGVTDAANHAAASDFRTNLELAMHNVAALVAAWVAPEVNTLQGGS